MRLLVVTYRFPAFRSTADRNVVYNLVKHLSRRHEVSLVAFATADPATQSTDLVRPYCRRTEVVVLPVWRSMLSAGIGLLGREPLQMRYYSSGAMRQRVAAVAREQRVQAAYGYHLRSWPYLAALNGVPKVLALHPAQVLHYGRLRGVIRSPLKRLVYTVEHRRLRGYERAVARRMDRCLLISPADRLAIDPDGELTNVVYNPHGTDVASFTRPADAVREPASLVFHGAMYMDTNTDAVLHFVRDVLPLIWRARPETRLYVVGRHPPRSIQRLAADPRIIVTGLVDDVRPYLWRATVAVDPIRIAAGMQNKVIEAMSAGLPMVVTSTANEGIGARDGEAVRVADEPEAFARAVLELLSDHVAARRLGEAGRRFVQEGWTWETHFCRLEALLEELAANAVTH